MLKRKSENEISSSILINQFFEPKQFLTAFSFFFSKTNQCFKGKVNL